jgi:alcohol dehydrogenase (cytochrome c)
VRLSSNGTTKTLVVTGGKPAIFDAVEAATGAYAFSFDAGLQNIVLGIDPKTGAKKIDESRIPGDGSTKFICPFTIGGKNWLPSAFNPNSKVLFVPLFEACADYIPVNPGERGLLSTGVRTAIKPRPDGDGQYGRLEAINLETRKVAWVARQYAPRTSGVLATAGGVVFAGSLDRVFAAYDDANGQELWRVRMNDVPSTAPISYLVNGKQYVAMVVGSGGHHNANVAPITPDIRNPPDRGAAVWAFELPPDGR